MARPRSQFPVPGSEDPMARALDDLEDRPQAEARPRRRTRSNEPRRPDPARDFPECPPERTERTWRVTRLFVETGEASQVRRISPWFFAKELAATINNSRIFLDFIRDHGEDLAEDMLGRMIRLFFRHYIDGRTSRSLAIDLFLDQYWDDLFDQAKTEYTTERIQQKTADGTLKVHPKQHYRSLLNDPDYQAAQQDIRVDAKLEEDLAVVDAALADGGAKQQS